MDNNKKFELDDDALDNVAGGMSTDFVQTEPTSQALARGMTLNMVYQVQKNWAKCDCGCDRYVVTGFLTDDTGFEQRCEMCGSTGAATYAIYDMVTAG